MRTSSVTRVAIFGLAVHGLVGCTPDLEVTPLYNHANGRVLVEMNRDIESEETLFIRARRGSFGVLDCAKLVTEIPAIEGASGDKIDGPAIDPALTKAFYGPEWAGEPTAAMLAQLRLGVDSIIDVCLMKGTEVVFQAERDLFAAWDKARRQGIGGKADDPSGEQRINSPEGYGERCVAELGEIPFFKKLGESNYETYDCLESTAIPMTVTHGDGTVIAPKEGTEALCDNPQYIYSLCEAGPRVATRINEQGTRWVLLCRKSIGGYASNQFNDIAMIGSNPFTGKTCFFQNALYSKTDGGHVPHPADKEKSKNLWSGVHGGVGSGIECGRCHDSDAFIHTPWIDGAKDTNGRTIVPKMGVDADFALGANDTPYAIVNRRGQGWTMPKQLISSEASACLKCHRMGDGKWADSWLKRLEGTDASWLGITSETGNQSIHKFWMPPDHSYNSDAEFAASESQRALDFIQACAVDKAGPGCIWKDVPEDLGGEASGGRLRNPVTLSDDALASQATTLLGMNKDAPSQVCAECHAPNQTTLRDWQDKTDIAVSDCLHDADALGPVHNDETPGVRVDNGEFKTFGPFDVAAGSFFEASIAGTGDIDLFVKRGAEVTKDVYDCRPFTQTSSETCNKTSFNASGPAKFWVGVNGTADGTVKITTKYTAPLANARPAKQRVDCFRFDPARADAPFVPSKIGIYAAAAHLGWFQDTFKAAYPAGASGNTNDTWALEYGKFKNRSSMPKGNHPRLTQGEFDVVAEWFDRGLPNLTTYIAADTGPTSCTQSISSAVSSHVGQMTSGGWGAINRQAGMNMYGCGGSSDPRSCLSSVPNAASKSYGTGWTAFGTLRVLRELAFNTFFWMRSSPDGRFVANGSTGGGAVSGGGSVISDLQSNKDIVVQAAYDPGFFPDNRGWVFQGTSIGAAFCTMGLLTSNPDRISFNESSCSSVATVSLYQHLGQGLGGGDYFVINSQFTSDNPSSVVTADPNAGFASSARIKVTPMVFDGTHYVGKPEASTMSPYEGDSVLSPSSNLVISRFGNESAQLGYVVRRLTATSNGASYDITTNEIGRYCVQGAKPSISFDEKYFVTHHYVGPSDFAELGYASASDPAFQAILAKGSANIIIVNMITGARTRVTTMGAGQYALFPHFRSDGWFYFLVRDHNTQKEYALASDAALQLN